MKKKTSLSEEDQALFRQLMTGTRKIKQDTIVHRPQRKKITEVAPKRLLQEQVDNSHYFSDEFQPLLNTEGSTKYVRPDVSHFELKKLRRGDYSPELFLDLHGLTQQQAKQELGALIAACRREHVFCACVMHGHGKHILKQQTPLWLAQHPQVARVNHPALPGSKGHEFWKRDFTGSSGLFSFVLSKRLNDAELAEYLDNFSLFSMAYSWGGFESLILANQPEQIAHIRPDAEVDFSGTLIRLHIGLENVDDLQADLAAGFARIV